MPLGEEHFTKQHTHDRIVIHHQNPARRPVDPIGEAKPDWEIMVLLSKKVQERAIARGVGAYQDCEVRRDLHTICDDFTMGGTLLTDHDAAKWLVDNNPELGGVILEGGAEQGLFVMSEAGGANQPIPVSELYTRSSLGLRARNPTIR